MTAPTHAAFGVLWAAMAGTSPANAIACALGALLPDIDHPQSSIGRILFFLSFPLNQRFGHRQLIHSFVFWSPLIIIGLLLRSPLTLWAGIGAISHIVSDAFTISGVKALLPWSERAVVFFKRDWRIYTGSVQEIVVFIVIAGMISLANYSYALGGPRKLINLLAKSHKITVEEYQRAGLKRCIVEGRWRWADGRIEEVAWLVVGMEGQRLVYWNEAAGKLIRDKKHGKFLKSVLKQSEEDWPVVEVEGLCRVKQRSFWFDGKRWYRAEPGELAVGMVKAASGGVVGIQIE